MATYPSILAVKSHGQRSPAGYSPWGHKELNMTEQLGTPGGLEYIILNQNCSLLTTK